MSHRAHREIVSGCAGGIRGCPLHPPPFSSTAEDGRLLYWFAWRLELCQASRAAGHSAKPHWPIKISQRHLRLMVIRFMALSHFLFTDFLPQFFVREAYSLRRCRGLFLKDTAHMMQQPGNGLEQEFPARFFPDDIVNRAVTLLHLLNQRHRQIAQLHRLLDDKVLDLLEFLLSGKRQTLRKIVPVSAQDVLPQLVPEAISLHDSRVLRQLIHDLIHYIF